MGSVHLGHPHGGRRQDRIKDIVEGENVREETDRVTGLTQMVIVESTTAEKRTPTVTVKTKKSGDPAPTLEELLRPEDEEALSLADFEDEQ